MNAVGPDLQMSGNNWEGATPETLRQKAGNNQSGLLWHPRMFETLEQEMAVFASEHQRALADVMKFYVVHDTSSVEMFLAQNRVVSQLLLEAVTYLREIFGTSVIRINVLREDELDGTLYAVVLWSGSAADVRQALNRFRESWWQKYIRQASGHLVFTYELI